VVGKGRFTLLTGIGGEAWVKAARAIAEQTGVEVEAFVVGPGRELDDLYGDWARLREITDNGCLLVRPDAHVAYRSHELPTDPTAALGDAFQALLSR
jgi:2,4-dichlorophenol 6-monooxygenase